MDSRLATSNRNKAFRTSQRLTITVAQSTLEALIHRSSSEGRSISNLAAYLLEASLDNQHERRSNGQRI